MRACSSFTPQGYIFLMVAAFAALSGQAQAQFTHTTTNGTITITGYTGSGGAVSIPGTINGLPVTSIAGFAFSESNLTSVIIPNSVTSIGLEAFNGCTNLTSATIGNNVTILGDFAFWGCSSLTGIVIPNSVTSIGNDTFTGCSNLTSLTIGNNVTSIGSFAFSACSNLTSLTIPNSVTSIGDEAFNVCTSLNSLTLGNNVTSIGNFSFFGCSNLTTVVIPDKVTSIGQETFTDCSKLSSVTIGKEVASIGIQAFSDCTSLKGPYFKGSPPSADTSVFYQDTSVTAYYAVGSSGWTNTFSDVPTALLNPPTIASQSTYKAELVGGANTTFTVLAGANPTPASYQWQVSTDGGNTWNNVNGSQYSGTTTAALSITTPSTTILGYEYRATVTNLAGKATTTPAPLIVATSIAKLDWLESNFSLAQLGNPDFVGDLAEPAGDGIPNLTKYAFNLNPLINGQPSLPQPTITNGQLTITFQPVQSDLTYTVVASTDLTNWSTTGVTQINGTQIVASYSLSSNSPAFLRVEITPAP